MGWAMSRWAPSTKSSARSKLAGAEFIDRGVRRRSRTPEEIEARYPGGTGDSRNAVLPVSRMLPPFTEDDLYDENGLPA